MRIPISRHVGWRGPEPEPPVGRTLPVRPTSITCEFVKSVHQHHLLGPEESRAMKPSSSVRRVFGVGLVALSLSVAAGCSHASSSGG
ncbi:hypothetical protein KDL01_40260, partial [Actinospica durhamensis]